MIMSKTNAARLLDKLRMVYELVEYQVDEEDLSATNVAAKLGQNIEQVFKTLVLRGDKTGIFVCVVPGGAELNIKQAAKISGNKDAAMVPVKDTVGLTGYIRGGCSPLGMKKKFPIFIHESCQSFPFIFVSAGIRGLQLKLAPQDLIRSTEATVCALL
jgi:Cys-tRNA(Pro)/Cys-tRNA(Cys) deacylase